MTRDAEGADHQPGPVDSREQWETRGMSRRSASKGSMWEAVLIDNRIAEMRCLCYFKGVSPLEVGDLN